VSRDGRSAKDEGLIRDVIAQWAHATGAKKANEALAHLTSRAVRYTLAPPLQAADEPMAGLNAWFATWRGLFRYEPHDLTVHVAGRVAFAHGLMHLVGTKADGFAIDLWFRQTWGLERTGERWLIVHLHQSVPFLMDGSFKAAVELKP
jgi:PhnB protein